MPIPELDSRGLLPAGVHECTVEEIEVSFGHFLASDRRPRLFRDLQRYVQEARTAEIGKFLIVNGSYVTAKPDPNDIDVLLVLRDDVDFGEPVPPFVYNSRSKRYVKREYGLDFYPAFEGDETYSRMLEVFVQVRNMPAEQKGVLKVVL